MNPADRITNTKCLYPLGERTTIRVVGRDRAQFLHNFCTNDIRSLRPGEGCEAFVTDVKGHVLGFVVLLAREEDILVWTVSGQAPALIAHWDRYCIREQVEFHDQSPQWASFCLHGTASETAAAGPMPRRWSHEALDVAEQGGLMAWEPLEHTRTWLILVPSTAVEALASLCRSVGARWGTWEEFDGLRIAHGFPEFGRDITQDNLPQEVNRDAQAIHFHKGCYLGQETVARIDALGHVNRRLVPLQFPQGDLPEPGAPLVLADADRPVGWVTSVGRWPNSAASVGLGYVRRECSAVGTVLQSPRGTAVISG